MCLLEKEKVNLYGVEKEKAQMKKTRGVYECLHSNNTVYKC